MEDKINQTPVTEKEVFSWGLKGKVVAIDHGGQVIRRELYRNLKDSNAIALTILDPASAINIDPNDLTTIGEVEIVQGVALGSGGNSMLHACLSVERSGTLPPLPLELIPSPLKKDLISLASVPIRSQALDRIAGITNVDWILLNSISNNLEVIEYGRERIAESLVIHVEVPVVETHKGQTDLSRLVSALRPLGFCLQTLLVGERKSYFPSDVYFEVESKSQAISNTAVFLPSEKRLSIIDNGRKEKLAFILDQVYKMHDLAYSILRDIDAHRAFRYLIDKGYVSKYYDEPSSYTMTAKDSPFSWGFGGDL